MEGTGALRGAAPRWSLAGDQQLLDLLQEIHQKIMSKCNDTKQRLEEMSRGLRDASVNLQNVNNKFLALSNTQFVESRVYEDDADVAPPAVDKEPQKPTELVSDLTRLKQSLQILESYHEPLLIVRDSDSDTDSDDNDDRLVLKPKDLYAGRPLPHIIGSQAWKTKWHAGLVPDESDSDSSTSKVEEVEQYSESEEERPPPHYTPDRTMSTSTLSLQSEAPVSVSPARPSPAAVAADLARRLGGDIKIPEREPVFSQPDVAPRKLYKPQEPLATTIFPDEPPPFDEQSSDDDIFAELHKTQPKPRGNTVEDLFGFNQLSSEEALFGAPKVLTNQNQEKHGTSEQSVPEISKTQPVDKVQPEENVKKPVGGISLFGTNKHAETIGAAILKRNRRKSSTSGDESNTEDIQVAKETVKEEVQKERDIFDDLFAKSEKLNKNNTKPEVKPKVIKPRDVARPEEAKKETFSDIFGDIDDIFSSNIVAQVKPTAKNGKSLFSDDDDLFAEVSTVKNDSEKIKGGMFENPEPDTTLKTNVEKENKVVKTVKEPKSIFDSDSDDGLFTSIPKDVKQNIDKKESADNNKLKNKLFDDDDDEGLFTIDNTKPKTAVSNIATNVSKKALFDSDDELFEDPKIINEPKLLQSRQSDNKVNELFATQIDHSEQHLEKSLNTKKRSEPDTAQEINKSTVQPTVIDSINNDIFSDMRTVKSQDESTRETSHDSFKDDINYSVESAVANSTATKSVDFTQNPQNLRSNNQISEDISDQLNKDTQFNKNILRTTRIAAVEEIKPEEKQTQDTFNDSGDDLFRSKQKNTKETVLETTTAPQIPDLFSSPGSINTFSDIFGDVPPVFEKPKEPKRSKNVNALFDDDSDDEALFFKKNDVITDEKPDFSPTNERFGIFHDEPPAIDIDFTQKPYRKDDVIKTPMNTENTSTVDKRLFLTKPVQAENIDEAVEHVGEPKREAQDTTDTAKEPKKVGKLKPMNININVNSLLPGASRNKRQVENIKVKQEHTASNEDLHKSEKSESNMVKSSSFDDPALLDNKISKERAKIRVKRRPSTRQARKEAVRKSAIDFTDSSFDSSNDNSIKDEVKETVVKTVYILNDDDIFGSTNNKTTNSTKKHLNIVDSDEELFKTHKSGNDYIFTNDNKPVEQSSDVFASTDASFSKPIVSTNKIIHSVDKGSDENLDESKSVIKPYFNKSSLDSENKTLGSDDKTYKIMRSTERAVNIHENKSLEKYISENKSRDSDDVNMPGAEKAEISNIIENQSVENFTFENKSLVSDDMTDKTTPITDQVENEPSFGFDDLDNMFNDTIPTKGFIGKQNPKRVGRNETDKPWKKRSPTNVENDEADIPSPNYYQNLSVNEPSPTEDETNEGVIIVEEPISTKSEEDKTLTLVDEPNPRKVKSDEASLVVDEPNPTKGEKDEPVALHDAPYVKVEIYEAVNSVDTDTLNVGEDTMRPEGDGRIKGSIVPGTGEKGGIETPVGDTITRGKNCTMTQGQIKNQKEGLDTPGKDTNTQTIEVKEKEVDTPVKDIERINTKEGIAAQVKNLDFRDKPAKDIITQGKIYKGIDTPNTDISKRSILDSSSDEEDLFKSKTKLIVNNKKSLFGDENDDDDDLFGTKTTKETKTEMPPTPEEKARAANPEPVKRAKTPEPVFVDPLSVFGDDDD